MLQKVSLGSSSIHSFVENRAIHNISHDLLFLKFLTATFANLLSSSFFSATPFLLLNIRSTSGELTNGDLETI